MFSLSSCIRWGGSAVHEILGCYVVIACALELAVLGKDGEWGRAHLQRRCVGDKTSVYVPGEDLVVGIGYVFLYVSTPRLMNKWGRHRVGDILAQGISGEDSLIGSQSYETPI